MAIKGTQRFKSLKLGIILVLISTILTIPFLNHPKGSNYIILLKNKPNMSASSDILVDKVYNFTISRPYVYFNQNLYLERLYNYFITICIVTPHTCDMNITLWDTEGDEFRLSFEKNMSQNDYREIPYGVAVNGNYSILFAANLTENLNILINIQRDGRCLYDKIQSEELSYIIFIDVLKFYERTHFSHRLSLKTDMNYRFYFGRVSAISAGLSEYTGLTHTITDETQGILFGIYHNDTIASPKGVTSYQFGTAIEGEYSLNLTIFCDVKAVNLAYAIVEEQRVADGIDPNDDNPPDPPDDPHNGTVGLEAFIPVEWTIGMIILAGCGVIIPIILIQHRKKKNPSGI
ncbi:MAG: hypothetical protein ACFFCY_05070 [Promethearchaeota archaeon]